MQTSLSRGCKPLVARRSAAAACPLATTSGSRRSSVQVFASKQKGKGKTAFRGGSSIPGAQEMRREPPTPEVDPENAEFVIFFRVLKFVDPMMKTTMGPSLWIPLSIVKGNQVSNFLVNAIKSEWGMKLYGRTLVWQMASGLYQDKGKVEKELRKQFKEFADTSSKDFQYAFKIRDKANPKDWTKTDNLTIFPLPEDLGTTGLELLKAFFKPDNLASMFKAPETPAAPQQ